jgi:hypothetical protein
MFNARFKALMKYVSNRYPHNLDFKTKISIVNDEIKSINNRILIHIFVDFILINQEIMDNMRKKPKDKHIKFWDNVNFNTYKDVTKRTSKDQIDGENPVFDQIKYIFKISSKSVKKYVISEFYHLKNLARKFVDTDE